MRQGKCSTVARRHLLTLSGAFAAPKTNLERRPAALGYGVTIQMNPDFPINTLTLMRSAIAMQMRGDAAFHRYLRAIQRHVRQTPQLEPVVSLRISPPQCRLDQPNSNLCPAVVVTAPQKLKFATGALIICARLRRLLCPAHEFSWRTFAS